MNRIRNSFLAVILLLIFLLSGCRSSRMNYRSKLDGIWTGYAYQFDIAESWEMVFICNTKTNEFVMDYPYLGCAAKWKAVKQKARVFEFEEVLEYGHEICIDNLRVVIELLDDNTLKASFYLSGDNQLNAVGKLTRQ